MNASCKTVSHLLNVFASSATLKKDTNSLEESSFMATNDAGNNETCLGVHKKCPKFLPDLIKFRFS